VNSVDSRGLDYQFGLDSRQGPSGVYEEGGDGGGQAANRGLGSIKALSDGQALLI